MSDKYGGILPSFILAIQDVLVSCCGKPRYFNGRMYNHPHVLKNVCTLPFVLLFECGTYTTRRLAGKAEIVFNKIILFQTINDDSETLSYCRTGFNNFLELYSRKDSSIVKITSFSIFRKNSLL